MIKMKDVKSIVGTTELMNPRKLIEPRCSEKVVGIKLVGDSPPRIGGIIAPRGNSHIHKIPEPESVSPDLTYQQVPRGAISDTADETVISINTLDDRERKRKKNSFYRGRDLPNQPA
jgi:hypothetical protein